MGGSLYTSVDPASSRDYGATATFRQDEEGNLHLLDVELIEPRNVTIEMALIPGSDPPRYEAK